MHKHRFRLGPQGMQYLNDAYHRDIGQPIAIVELRSPFDNPLAAWHDFLLLALGSRLGGTAIELAIDTEKKDGVSAAG